jgi:IS1 family transposase
VQRYACDRCGKSFSESQPLDGLRIETKQVEQVVHLLCESMGIRAIQRITGLHQETILNILETVGQKAAAFLDAQVRNVNASVIQADEVYSIVGCRQENALPKETERGGQFTFLSVARNSKLIINWFVGKRTRENADQFFGDLKNRVANRMQLVTDGYKGYSGIGGTVAAVFGDDVDYCTETKYFGKPDTFLPRQVIGLRRRRRIGNPDMKLATTAHAERTNLSVRTFTRRFTRCTLGYSKKLENLKHAVALFVWHFNFVRKHSAHGMTPAQAAGLADRVWTIGELLSAQS